MKFLYEIENNGVKVPLVCECACSQGIHYLVSAKVGDWNLVDLMTEEEQSEIEDYYMGGSFEVFTSLSAAQSDLA